MCPQHCRAPGGSTWPQPPVFAVLMLLPEPGLAMSLGCDSVSLLAPHRRSDPLPAAAEAQPGAGACGESVGTEGDDGAGLCQLHGQQELYCRAEAGSLLAVAALRVRLGAALDPSSSHVEQDQTHWVSEPEPHGTAALRIRSAEAGGKPSCLPGIPRKPPRLHQAAKEPGCLWPSRFLAPLPKLPTESLVEERPGTGWPRLEVLQRARPSAAGRQAGGCADGKQRGEGEVGVAIFARHILCQFLRTSGGFLVRDFSV